MIFRPFGAKKNKKNWIWKMTLDDPPPSMEFSIMDYFFFEPFPNKAIQIGFQKSSNIS